MPDITTGGDRMRIAPAQDAALSRDLEERFDRRLTDFLRQEFPDARDEPYDQMQVAVSEEKKQARGYGLLTERQIATYVTAAWLLGRDFDTAFPAAESILPSTALTPDQKTEWLDAWARETFERREGGD